MWLIAKQIIRDRQDLFFDHVKGQAEGGEEVKKAEVKKAEVKKAEAAAKARTGRSSRGARAQAPRVRSAPRVVPARLSLFANRASTSEQTRGRRPRPTARKKEKKSRDRQDLNLRGHCPRDIQ